LRFELRTFRIRRRNLISSFTILSQVIRKTDYVIKCIRCHRKSGEEKERESDK
jgi:hypothetical protein